LVPYERQNLADAINPMIFEEGEYIIKQGEIGEKF